MDFASGFDFPPHILVLVALTFLVAGFVKGVVGVGFPTISVGVMTATIGLQPALALVVAPAIVTNIWQAFTGGQFKPLMQRLWPFYLTAGLFTWVGVALVVITNHPLLPLVLAASLILHSVLSLAKVKLPIPATRERLLSPTLGAVTGILMGLTGSGTVPSVYYFDALGLNRHQFVQGIGILFLALTVALGLSLAERNAYDTHMVALSVAGLVPSIAGVYVGQLLRHRMSEPVFKKTLYLAILALGMVILVRTI